jgi:hypothetical protein
MQPKPFQVDRVENEKTGLVRNGRGLKIKMKHNELTENQGNRYLLSLKTIINLILVISSIKPNTCKRSTIFPFVAARAQALMVLAAFCLSSKLIEAAEALKFI